MDFGKMTIDEYVKGIKSKKFATTDAVKTFVDKCKADKKNAVLEVFNSWSERAKEIDKMIADGEDPGELAGVPIIIKDNIWYKGHKCAAGSKMLQDFIAPQSAYVVRLLLKAGAVIIARSNMDEFGMGSTGRNSAFGPTLNALSDKHVAGGSSSGSAVALALGYCLAALGTDTGGSMRCPAAYNGIVGMKPSYGVISRYGVMAYAGSIEQVGVFGKNVEDTLTVLKQIRGHDTYDMTTVHKKLEDKKFDIKKLKIGRIKEVWDGYKSSPYFPIYENIFTTFKKAGAQIVDISISNLSLALPAYYIISCTEAASNMSRLDGVRYTKAVDSESLDELYVNSRTKYLGEEVKRRIMLGNFLACAGHESSELYKKAKMVQSHVAQEIAHAFEQCDTILMPSMTGEATLLDQDKSDPVAEYLADLFTVPSNIAGIPTISIPCGVGVNKLPLGLQILTQKYNGGLMFDIAKWFEKSQKEAR
ncbi:MAG: aspartyl/glutamyl-tRNA amidotransferase subunit A [Firmicutes bacterium]|nr:aspartyl/glutamyl-tRNA amidotransferase subunit A [Bacillota bacterium]